MGFLRVLSDDYSQAIDRVPQAPFGSASHPRWWWRTPADADAQTNGIRSFCVCSKFVREMNQGTESIAGSDAYHPEKPQLVNAYQGQDAGPFPPPSTAGAKAASWSLQWTNNASTENAASSYSGYPYEQKMEVNIPTDVRDGINVSSHASTSNLVAENGTQEYVGYASYPSSSTNPGYGNPEYQSYYYNYQQPSNPSSSQQVGASQNSGAPYQPLSSFQNTASYVGPTSYSGTYYNTGDYQTTTGYQSSVYSEQTNWNCGNYPHHQYSNYSSSDATHAPTSTVAATPPNYQPHYNQWADYYNQTSSNVMCAPGTENVSVTTVSTSGYPVAGITSGYSVSSNQPPPPGTTSWRQDPSSSTSNSLQVSTAGYNHDGSWKNASGFQHHVGQTPSYTQKPLETAPHPYDNRPDHQQLMYSQRPNSQLPTMHEASQNHQTAPALDARWVSKVQIPTNPRIASPLALGMPKTDKDSSTTADAVAKPAYISVTMPNSKGSSDGGANATNKQRMFPTSFRAYMERTLARCKDDSQREACQTMIKEMVTKASADGTLFTRDWDTEPLLPLPNTSGAVDKDNVDKSLTMSIFSKYKRSPSRRTKSRWEPIPDEKLVENASSAGPVKDAFWNRFKQTEKTVSSVRVEGKVNGWSNAKLVSYQQQFVPGKNAQRPDKKQRLSEDVERKEKGDASSDSDKEQALTAYYASAIALANSPEEKKKRESRSKRFDKGQESKAEIKYFRPKSVGGGNLYTRKSNALILAKSFEDSGSRAVEDMDWDSLTVKGTCQEIEKRYLRLTSAPDPCTVRPEDVLEKALQMIQSSQKNYLYKCDQLKSIRQDLTVQRIHNELTVKVYETHARMALEAGDLPEFNQCQSQLKSLYAEGIKGCHMEFSAYNLLAVILHSNNNRDFLSSMARLSPETKKGEAVQHALAVREAVTSGNYVLFFRLYKTAPNLNTCLMDLYVEKMRFEAVKCISRAYRPTVPVTFISEVLGFASDEKDVDGPEECEEWLRAHAIELKPKVAPIKKWPKASSSGLFMPEPEDAVSHGDTSLAVNDFLTRTS
ncbi:hypothetical protein QJS04_geneDACA024123 [Acorus gramineus]|uniref:PCI domain-containing protein n=1 Tax=Acorus gramineus TaxID=55184 RepID=A0AAV8ZXZ3_ACOGR|nr:hypothetical protein QJS04_geneDACA024123 [Acorus gramineus]